MCIAFMLYRNCLKYKKALRLLEYCRKKIIQNWGSHHPLSIKAVAWTVAIYKTRGKQRRAKSISNKFGYQNAVAQHSSYASIRLKNV